MSKKSDPVRDDFRNFLFLVWSFLNLPPPTAAQYDMAVYLQHGPRRAVLEGFRGVGKSWITGAYVCWLLYCETDHKIMVVSASKNKSDEFSTFVLRLLREMPLLQHLQPRHGQRESMVAFDVCGVRPDPSPSVKSVGITGQITGSRANTIVADDIEVPTNSDTQTKRDILSERVKEFDAVIKPGGRIMYLGTPQTEQSIYNELPGKGYVIRQWPCRIPENVEKYGNRLAPYIQEMIHAGAIAGAPTDAARFDDEDLRERALSYGRAGFALQFMLDTELSDADKHPLKLSDLIVYPCDPYRGPTDLVWASSPELVRSDLPSVGLSGDRYYRPAWASADFAPYAGGVMYVDPSGRGRDETAYACVRQLNGKLFLVASGGFLGGYEQRTLRGLLDIAKHHGISKIVCEPNFGGGMFTQLLKAAASNYYVCGIEDAEWQTTAKEARIVAILEPVLQQHRLVVDPKVIQADYDNVPTQFDRSNEYRLFHQLTRVTAEPGALVHDDRLDALAGAVRFYTAAMAQDAERAVLSFKEEKLAADLQKFLKGALGQSAMDPGTCRIRR